MKLTDKRRERNVHTPVKWEEMEAQGT